MEDSSSPFRMIGTHVDAMERRVLEHLKGVGDKPLTVEEFLVLTTAARGELQRQKHRISACLSRRLLGFSL